MNITHPVQVTGVCLQYGHVQFLFCNFDRERLKVHFKEGCADSGLNSQVELYDSIQHGYHSNEGG